MKSTKLKLVKSSDMRPVAQGRKPNEAYRIREHLTELEVDWLLAASSAIGTGIAIGSSAY